MIALVAQPKRLNSAWAAAIVAEIHLDNIGLAEEFYGIVLDNLKDCRNGTCERPEMYHQALDFFERLNKVRFN